jgi:hypothetical protein
MAINKIKRYFVYIDRIKNTDVVFYVGEGNEARSSSTRKQYRNFHYNQIAKKYGVDRERIEVFNKATALFMEERLIQIYHTFVDDPMANEYACNYKKAGDDSAMARCVSWNRGKTGVYSQEAIEKMINTRSISVTAFDKITGKIFKTFKSAHEAAIELKTTPSGITQCCLKKHNTYVKYVWRYTKDVIGLTQIDVNFTKKEHNFAKQIVSFYKNGIRHKTWCSIINASTTLQINYDDIIKSCQKKNLYAGDYIWRYYSEVKDLDKINVRTIKQTQKLKRQVNQYDLNDNFIATYSSIIEAYLATNCSSIWKVCNGYRKSTKGFKFYYADQDPNVTT